MDNNQHESLIESIAKGYADILEHSKQGVYIYLDDAHKICNKYFAELLGYESPEEWAKVDESFPVAFVATKSQKTLVSSYQDAMENMVGSTNTILWKKKDGTTVNTEVILVPIVYDNHLFALHFVVNK